MSATKTSVCIALCITLLLLSISTIVKSDDPTSLKVETNSTQQPDSVPAVLSHDIDTNTIAGSSNYVPERENSKFLRFDSDALTSNSSATNTTSSQANVYQASTNTEKDPLLVNAQQNNPFISGAGGVNPQITMLLRNNPRLAMLARQNPMVAQQIMRNPQMLRDPAIQRAINSQLQPGQRANLINQLGNIGLLNGIGRALNPLGIGMNRGQNNQNNGYNNGVNNGGLSNGMAGNGMRNGMGGNGMGGNALRNNLENNYRLARNQQPQRNSHSDTLPGGYYGGNRNYGQPAVRNNQNANNENEENENEGNEDENSVDTGNQDYDDSGNGGNDGNQEGSEDDGQQNPAEDPDIQQLQNFGGGGDNFPEGLFPPGLLSKEDMDEIRKQQEKQAREEQQRQQQEQANQSPDYENGGEEGEGNGEEGADNGNGEEAGGQEEVPTDNGNHGQAGHGGQVGHNENVHNNNNNGNAYGQAGQLASRYGQTTPSPVAYQNSYQPIQPHPVTPQQTPILQPGISYANQYPPVQQPQQNGYPPKNRFNYQPSVEYDHQRQPQPQYNPVNQYQYTTTPPPAVSLPSPGIGQQYHGNRPQQLYNTFSNQPPAPPTYNQAYGQVPQANPLGGQYPPVGIPRPGPQTNRMWPQQVYNTGPHNTGYTPAMNNQQFNNPTGIGMPNVRNMPNYPNFGNGQQTPLAYQNTPSPAYQSNYPLTNDRRRALQSSPVLFR